MNRSESVAVIGLGYIGLPVAAILANKGHRLYGIDLDGELVAAVNRGEVPFVEPDLETNVTEAVQRKSLSAQTNVPEADVYIIAVPTPLTEGKKPDLSFVERAADDVARVLRGGELVVLESTCPPGTTEYVAERILKNRPDLDQLVSEQQVHFAHCPERVLPGRIMVEMVVNDRVIGGVTPEAARRAKFLYESFSTGELLVTDARTAEFVKLVENSFRDVNIAFANELSTIASKIGVNVWRLIELANHHPRVNILSPGPGVGGHCIPVDPWFLAGAFPDETDLLQAARKTNDGKPGKVIAQIEEAILAAENPTIAMLGLAFKPEIEDTRLSPAIEITEQVALKYPTLRILAVEPHLSTLPANLEPFENVELTEYRKALTDADIIVHLVDHKEFMGLNHLNIGKCTVIETCRNLEVTS